MPRVDPAKQESLSGQTRPDLTTDMMPAEFFAWYWLKSELLEFCRVNGLRAGGSKPDLESRIEAFLAGRPVPKGSSPARPATKMPATFRPEMRLEPGWRCSPALGAYFRDLLGNGFRFNKAMRDFIHTQQGRTLFDAEQCYLSSVRPGRARLPIPRQLEYNQHFREYYAKHPEASRKEVIEAWWKVRRSRKISS